MAAGPAAEHAPGLIAEAVEAPHRDHRLVGDAFELDHHRRAAAVGAVAETVGHQRVAAHDQRRIDLDAFDRRALQIADHRVVGVDAVHPHPGAGAAGEGLDHCHPCARRRLVGPGDADDAGLAGAAGSDRAGDRLVEAAHQRIIGPHHGDPAIAHGGGEGGVHERAARRMGADRPYDAAIDRRARLDRVDVVGQREAEEGMRAVAGGEIHCRMDLRIAAGIVDFRLVAGNGQPAAYVDRIVLPAALQIVGEMVGAVLEPGDDAARFRLGIVHDGVDRVVEGFDAHPGADFADAPLQQPHRRLHRLQIAPDLRADTGVVLQDVDDVAVEHPFAPQLDRPELDAFLIDLGQVGSDAARHRAADVGGVDECPGEADELALEEDRLRQMDVHRVGDEAVGAMRIVGDDHVAGGQIAAEGLDQAADVLADGRRHAGHGRKGEELAGGPRQRDLEILRLLDEGGVGGAVGDRRGLLGDGRETVPHDLGERGVQASSSISIHKSPRPPTLARKPGGTRMVATSCSMIAGPRVDHPSGRSPRS